MKRVTLLSILLSLGAVFSAYSFDHIAEWQAIYKLYQIKKQVCKPYDKESNRELYIVIRVIKDHFEKDYTQDSPFISFLNDHLKSSLLPKDSDFNSTYERLQNDSRITSMDEYAYGKVLAKIKEEMRVSIKNNHHEDYNSILEASNFLNPRSIVSLPSNNDFLTELTQQNEQKAKELELGRDLNFPLSKISEKGSSTDSQSSSSSAQGSNTENTATLAQHVAQLTNEVENAKNTLVRIENCDNYRWHKSGAFFALGALAYKVSTLEKVQNNPALRKAAQLATGISGLLSIYNALKK